MSLLFVIILSVVIICYVEYSYGMCRKTYVVMSSVVILCRMLNVVMLCHMLSVVMLYHMLSVIVLSVVMLCHMLNVVGSNVIMPRVVEPC